ncbi:MAG: undecaprenyl-phosphate galactose phosphotransferase WbaP [Treponema sp.]|nr:undecaprenyl-phosphate galactose phosphotransferase WbaP [Treponema sp.]
MTVDEFLVYYKQRFRRTSSFLSGAVLMLIDAVALMLSIGTGFFIINAINNSFINFRSFVTYSVYLPLILLVFYVAGLYPGIMISPVEEIKRFCLCTFFSFAGIAISIFIDDNKERIAVAIALLLAVPVATFFLPIARQIMRTLFSRFRWWGLPAVIYCTGSSGNEVIDRMLKQPDLGYKPALIVDSSARKPREYNGIPVFAPSKELLKTIRSINIKVAILCDYQADIFKIMQSYRYTITVSKKQDALMSGSPQLKDIGGIIGLASTHHLTQKGSLMSKRMLDIAIIIISLPLVLLLCIIIALIVKITSPGPVFYGHARVGKDRKPLKCWKFRSMYKDADKQLDKLLAQNPNMRTQWEKERKFINDPRITPFGKFIRRTSLDELPQLWNIFLGQMSFVGPRPVTEGELTKYGERVNYILSVTPGLSGMWQTSGRSDTAYEERITLDSYYIQNWSVWLDIWILIKTVRVVIKGKGAY